MADSAAAGSGPRDLLPIPTDDSPDVGSVLRANVTDLKPGIDVLIGPDDAGKSALLRALAMDHQAVSHLVQFFDLSITDWRELLLAAVSKAEVVLIDHLDRIHDSEHFTAAFDVLDRAIPAIFARGLSVLALSLGQEWRDTFRATYRMNPETLLKRSMPTIDVNVHYIRPYDEAELTVLCRKLELNPGDFADVGLRRAGVLAMASAASSEPTRLSGPALREVLAMRWVQAGHSPHQREARKAIWNLMGKRILRDGIFSVELAEAYAEFHGRFTTDTLKDQVGGPVRWEDDQLQPDSPSWGDVAAAKALGGIIKSRSLESIKAPIRSTVLDALIDISERDSLATQVERKLHFIEGTDFASTGYLGPVLATLLTQVSQRAEITLQQLNLQGPEHHELRPIGASVAEMVEDALISSLELNAAELMEMLRRMAPSAVSAYRGGYECWEAVRAWASRLPLRAAAEDVVSRLLPHDGSWHYEDVLDVSVTQATTRLMANNARALESALSGCPSPAEEYLADIWDGVNDGAWDQIDETSSGFISSWRLHSGAGKVLDIEGCRLQRARLGIQDADRWRLVNCDLFLADFRSCRNLEKADLSGSNWWSAILPPPARYSLSRSCEDSRFLAWCDNPPWRNPYFTGRWPRPFEKIISGDTQ